MTLTLDRYSACKAACDECADECERCANACLDERDPHKFANCVKLDRDCADLCRQLSTLMSRHSRFTLDLARLVAKACEACAIECEHHAEAHCRECAGACRRCAMECMKMVA